MEKKEDYVYSTNPKVKMEKLAEILWAKKHNKNPEDLTSKEKVQAHIEFKNEEILFEIEDDKE